MRARKQDRPGQRLAIGADDPALQPGINAVALTYDLAHRPELARLMTPVEQSSGRVVNRMTHLSTSSGDLLNKLEAVRLICQETGCAQRYLTHDALNAIGQVSARIDDARGSTEHTARFQNYLHRVQDQDLTLGVAMTDMTLARESIERGELMIPFGQPFRTGGVYALCLQPSAAAHPAYTRVMQWFSSQADG